MSKESLQLDFKNDQFQYKIVRTKVTILCVKTCGISKAVITALEIQTIENPLISSIFYSLYQDFFLCLKVIFKKRPFFT